jgi:predicted RNA-binding protein YlxR (DUF448 family)/ribosomal protein L30E
MKLPGMTATLPDSDEPEDEPETGPLRRCLVTRAHIAREAGLRFVVGPAGQLIFDAAATLPGRGLWLSARPDVIGLALKRGVFPRAAKLPGKAQVNVPADLGSQVAAALRRRIVELIGLARRGGGAICGFETAREWLVAGKAGLVIQARDGSLEERTRFIGGRDVAVVAPLNAAELGQVFGREHVVHAVIVAGKLAKMIEIEANRLAGVAGEETSGHIAPSVDPM